VNEMAVNVEEDCAIVSLVDNVIIEDFVVEGLRTFY